MTVLSGGLRERAKVVGWDTEHRLKVHLDQTASDVFRMIPEETLLTMQLLTWGGVSSRRISKNCMILSSTMSCK